MMGTEWRFAPAAPAALAHHVSGHTCKGDMMGSECRFAPAALAVIAHHVTDHTRKGDAKRAGAKRHSEPYVNDRST